MNIGKLNCRIKIKKAVETKDKEGNPVFDYVLRAKVWANIKAIRAQIRNSTVEENHEILQHITIRYNKSVQQTDQIFYGSRVFNQIGPPINIEEKNAYMRLECREVVQTNG